MTTRRTLLLSAGLALVGRTGEAATASIALRPGRPRAAIQARTVPLSAGEAFVITFATPGEPATEIRLPTWYGDGRILRSLPISGREVLLAAFQGNRGTGLSQKLMAAIGCDEAGTLRILAIETLSFNDAQAGSAARRMEGALEAVPARDALLLRHTTTARERSPGGHTAETRARWTTRLAWSGSGILATAPTPGDAGGIRRRVDAARLKMSAILAASPVTDATALDYDGTGIWAVGYAVPVS